MRVVEPLMGALSLLTILAIIGVFTLIALTEVTENNEKKIFMASCIKDHKEYECTALWRAAPARSSVAPILGIQ